MLGAKESMNHRKRNPHVISKYPANWPKVTRVLKRSVGYRCEGCGKQFARQLLSVHHKGIPYANGRLSDPRDKHDLRRENLRVTCDACHDLLDGANGAFIAMMQWSRAQAARIQSGSVQSRRQKHRTLGVGTGLVALSGV